MIVDGGLRFVMRSPHIADSSNVLVIRLRSNLEHVHATMARHAIFSRIAAIANGMDAYVVALIVVARSQPSILRITCSSWHRMTECFYALFVTCVLCFSQMPPYAFAKNTSCKIECKHYNYTNRALAMDGRPIFLADVIAIISRETHAQITRVFISMVIAHDGRAYVDLLECVAHPGVAIEAHTLREMMRMSLCGDVAHCDVSENNERTCATVCATYDGVNIVRKLRHIAAFALNKPYGEIVKQTLRSFLEQQDATMMRDIALPGGARTAICRAIDAL